MLTFFSAAIKGNSTEITARKLEATAMRTSEACLIE